MHVIILAGGVGSRLGGVAKAEVRVNGTRLIDALATDRRVVLYCASGIRSARAVSMLDADGHHGAYSLRGGITAWLEAGEQEARQHPVR